MNIEIKNLDNNVIFSYDCENNNIKKTIKEAVKQNVYLSGANLKGACLKDMNLNGVNLSKACLIGANFKNADLENANLEYIYAQNANFCNANLKSVFFQNANLYSADFKNADLENANLEYTFAERANFYSVNFKNANLENANFWATNLENVNFENTNIKNIDIREAIHIPYIPMNLPEKEFIGWKIFENGLIAKLKILKDSKCSRATGDKCRCDKALVLEFQNINGHKSQITEYTNYNYTICQYKVGEIVYADSWDEYRWNECSHGIHFFLDRETAVNYYYIKFI